MSADKCASDESKDWQQILQWPWTNIVGLTGPLASRRRRPRQPPTGIQNSARLLRPGAALGSIENLQPHIEMALMRRAPSSMFWLSIILRQFVTVRANPLASSFICFILSLCLSLLRPLLFFLSEDHLLPTDDGGLISIFPTPFIFHFQMATLGHSLAIQRERIRSSSCCHHVGRALECSYKFPIESRPTANC